MQIDLSRLKLRPQGSENFYLEEQGNDDILDGSGGRFLDNIVVELRVENTGRLFLARGTVKTRLGLPCSRCLMDFSLPIQTDIELEMVPASMASNSDADDETIIFYGDLVDLSIPIHEAVFMAIPIIPICQADCRGLCPVCGIDQNQGECSCIKQEIDPRWEKLKNL